MNASSTVKCRLFIAYALTCMLGMAAFNEVAHASSSKAEAEAEAEAGRESRVEEFAQMEKLFSALQKVPSIEATFKEEKHLELLALPLISEGTIYFHRKGYLLRKVSKPTPSSVRITPNALVVEERGGSQRIELKSHKEIAHVVQSFLWILGGDLSSLKQHFSLSFEAKDTGVEGLPTQWTLTLTPNDARVSKLIASIVVKGSSLTVHEIRVQEEGGDYTVTRISDVDLSREFGDEEADSLFGRSR